MLKQTQAAALTLKIELYVAEARTPDLLESAFTAISATRTGALIVFPDPCLPASTCAWWHSPQRSASQRYLQRSVAAAGGLMAYGPNIPAVFRGLGAYVDKIFHGAHPAELPVEQPTKFDLVINLKTAKTLGLKVPDKLLSTADKVIE